LLERVEGNGKVKYFCSDPACTNAAPKRVGRRKKVATASLMEAESGVAAEKTKKTKTRRKTAKAKTAGTKKRGRKPAVKKAEE
jgi:DNA topoisomerase-1